MPTLSQSFSEEPDWPPLQLAELNSRNPPQWKVFASAIVLQTPWLALRQDNLSLSEDQTTTYTFLEKQRSVIVIAENPYGDILCVTQYRYPVKRWLVEFPCGEAREGETPQEAATRELLEETGYQIDENGWTIIGRFFEGASFSNHYTEVLLGKVSVPRQSTLKPEPCEEGMSAGWLKPSQILPSVDSRDIVDGPTLAAALIYGQYQLRR